MVFLYGICTFFHLYIILVEFWLALKRSVNLVRFVEAHLIFLGGEFMQNAISAIDFTEEVYTALKDYFIGNAVCGVDQITFTLLGGQKFVISIREV